jgi:AcrR family transcriptional regulator
VGTRLPNPWLESDRQDAAAAPAGVAHVAGGGLAAGAGSPAGEGARRGEILETAAALFASSGYVSTSLKEIADACGILPGSLYHHFESKEAIVIELLTRYQAELDAIGNCALELVSGRDAAPPAFEQILSLATAIAGSAVRNRAAHQLTFYEPPSGASRELVELSRRRPLAVNAAMQEVLHRCQAAGFIKPGIDVFVLAQQLSHALRQVGIAYLNHGPADQIAATLCHMLCFGVATRPPSDAQLDRSPAAAAAEAAVRAWAVPKDEGLKDKVAALRSVARAEFARRGYEATTIRDIAAAAGVGTGTVYRIIESKEALVVSVMDAFHRRVSDGYDAVLATRSDTVAKLDALTWLNINARDLFSEEFAIQQSWLRTTPPAAAVNLGSLHDERTRQIGALVAEGFRAGELRAGHMGPEYQGTECPGTAYMGTEYTGTAYTGAGTPSIDQLANCVRNLIWVPRQVTALQRKRQALRHSRATFLRGAAVAAAVAGAVDGVTGATGAR